MNMFKRLVGHASEALSDRVAVAFGVCLFITLAAAVLTAVYFVRWLEGRS